MTAPTVERTPEDGRLLVRPPTLGRRRPVLSFVGGLGLIVLVLAVVGQTGMAAPRVSLVVNGSLGDPMTGCVAMYSLVNDGYRPAEVEGVVGGVAVGLLEPGNDLDPRRASPTMTLTPDDLPPFAPFTLAAGSTRLIAVEVPCTSSDPGELHAVVRVRSADLGVRRDVRSSYSG